MKNKNLIVIIARESGRYDVSKQNLRLVNGKPLLSYVIKTAKESKNCYTIVSTDSDEVKQYAEFYQVPVLDRSKKLTKDDTKLIEIASEALTKLEKKGLKFRKCLILHPHFPLIKKETIQRFFSSLNKKVSIIYGYEKEVDYNFAKIKKNFELEPLSKENVKIIKIVSFDCQKLLHIKTDNKIFGLGISSDEIFTPHNYHQFAYLESVMKRKKIIVRVDADINTGLGHVYNMLTILNNIRNDDILVIMNAKKNLGFKKFKEHLYAVKTYSDENEFWKIIRNFKPDIIFNDILNTTSYYIKKLKKEGIFVVNFEDLGEGRKFADLVFNPIFESKKQMKNEYYGPNYACVREEFRVFKRKKIRKYVKNIAITLGGVDKDNNVLKILSVIRKFKLLENVKIKIILGLGYKQKKKLLGLTNKMNSLNHKIEIVEKVDLLSKHLIDCDFVIASNGRTVLEIASLNIPLISLSVNKREQQHNFVRKFNVGYHIDYTKNIEDKLKSSIENMMDFSIRKKKIKNLEKEDLRKGITTVTTKIMSEYESTTHNE
jgi:spore coat polysaccharide biosynthesis predicted glycosyltransferase SpsG/CMP-N-acetylneuraminic acid synthetase